MADAKLKIIISAVDETSGPMSDISKSLDGLLNVGSTLKSIFAMAGIGLGIAEIGRAAIALGKMGEESALLNARSAALSGGIGVLTKNVSAMNAVVGDALTRDDLMATSTAMLTSGVATTAQAMSNLAEMAIRLGPAEEEARAKVDGFTRALQTGRATALIPYGFNLAELTQRQKELQASNAGLTDKQALANAALELGASRVQQLRDANVPLVTSTEAMTVATNNLKDALGDLAAPAYTSIVERLTQGAKSLTAILTTPQEQQALTVAASQLDSAEGALQAAVEGLKQANIQGQYLGGTTAEWTIEVDRARAAVDAAEAALRKANDQIAIAARNTTAWEDRLWGSVAAASAAMSAIEVADLRWQGMGAAYERRRQDDITDKRARNADVLRWAAMGEAAKKTNTVIADDYVTKMNSAADRVRDYAASAVQKAQTALQGLIGAPQDMLAPGANGPFENIFRAADVARLGDQSPWAAQLGMDQATAAKIVADFQNGLLTSQVKALINMPQLIDQAKMAGLAERLKEQFIAEVSKAAGTGTTIVEAVMGIKRDNGVLAGLDNVAPKFETAGSNFVGKLIAGIGGKTTDLTDAVETLVDKMLAAINAAISSGTSGQGAASGTGGSNPQPGHQAGTLWAPGGWALVGERGPELVRLPSSSRVYAADRTARMVGAGNAWNVTINVAGADDPLHAARAVESAVRRAAWAMGSAGL